MKFGGLQKLTLLDYPQKVACTVFTTGCNMRCPFCHNASLVCGCGEQLDEQQILAFLAKRANVLEGMCLTGGEPLIQAGVVDFLRKVKALGYAVKLDTNGTNPTLLKQLVEQRLVDYVAMDVKNSKDLYSVTTGCKLDMDAICASVDLLKSNVVDYEFRTTVTGNYHTAESILHTAQWLVGAKRWYLQQFVDSGDLIDGSTFGCSVDTLKSYLDIAKKYLPTTQLRGVE